MDSLWHAIYQDDSEFHGDTHPSMDALRTGKEVHNVVMGVFHPLVEECRWINLHAVPQLRPGEKVPYQVCTTFDDITDGSQWKPNKSPYSVKSFCQTPPTSDPVPLRF